MRRCPPEATVEMRLEDVTWGVAQKATALVQPHQLPALACFLDRLWQVRLKNLEQVLSERLRVDDDAQAIAHVRRKHLNSSADVEQRRRKTFGIDLIQQLCTLIFTQRIVHHPREAKSWQRRELCQNRTSHGEGQKREFCLRCNLAHLPP